MEINTKYEMGQKVYRARVIKRTFDIEEIQRPREITSVKVSFSINGLSVRYKVNGHNVPEDELFLTMEEVEEHFKRMIKMCVSNKDIQSEIIRQRIREGMVKELRNQMSRKQIAKVRIAYNKVSVGYEFSKRGEKGSAEE